MSRSSSAKFCAPLWRRLHSSTRFGEWSSYLSNGPPMEETVKEMYRNGLGTVARHVTAHQAVGESLLDNEKEFAIRCNC